MVRRAVACPRQYRVNRFPLACSVVPLLRHRSMGRVALALAGPVMLRQVVQVACIQTGERSRGLLRD